MFVTTYTDRNGNDEAFIRLNRTLKVAISSAVIDMNESLESYDTQNGTQVIDISVGVQQGDATIVRIINPNNGYEYEALVIHEKPVGD